MPCSCFSWGYKKKSKLLTTLEYHQIPSRITKSRAELVVQKSRGLTHFRILCVFFFLIPSAFGIHNDPFNQLASVAIMFVACLGSSRLGFSFSQSQHDLTQKPKTHQDPPRATKTHLSDNGPSDALELANLNHASATSRDSFTRNTPPIRARVSSGRGRAWFKCDVYTPEKETTTTTNKLN